MGMSKTHYFGWFFLCTKPVDLEKYFPNEEFYRVFDEGGSKLINYNYILIPNRQVKNCYHFNNYTDKPLTILPFEDGKIVFTPPPEIRAAMNILREEKPEIHFGYFSYTN